MSSVSYTPAEQSDNSRRMGQTVLVIDTDAVSLEVDGLLLDCDGVLVDSHSASAIAWNLWAKRWVPGFDFHRDVEHGRRITDLVAELISTPADVDEAAADLRQQELDHAADVTAIYRVQANYSTQAPPEAGQSSRRAAVR